MTTKRDVTTAANVILANHEDKNEYHFHNIDREWIIKAMIEYAELRLKDVKEYLFNTAIHSGDNKNIEEDYLKQTIKFINNE